jgi:hypothetical protein
MSLKDSAARPAFRSGTKSLSPILVTTEGQAPIAELSPSKRHALVSCFNAGGLRKKDRSWHGPQGGKPISGITTADLARDGMLTLTVQHRDGSARLTERGNLVRADSIVGQYTFIKNRVIDLSKAAVQKLRFVTWTLG